MSRLALLFAGFFLALTSTTAIAGETAGDHVDDPLTTARVKMALLDSSLSDASDINVETSKGIVQLSGFLGSKDAKISAGQVAAGVEDVKDVSNRITVRTGKRSVGKTLDDTILASKVKLALAEEESTDANRINVEVREGVVELSGFVGSYADRNTAVEFVSRLDGVKDVINSMAVMQ